MHYISFMYVKSRLDKRIDINILKDGKKAIKINKIKSYKNWRTIWKF